jgi:hypothetical protein
MHFHLSFTCFFRFRRENSFKTYIGDVDEEEELSEYSMITNEVNFSIFQTKF